MPQVLLTDLTMHNIDAEYLFFGTGSHICQHYITVFEVSNEQNQH